MNIQGFYLNPWDFLLKPNLPLYSTTLPPKRPTNSQTIIEKGFFFKKKKREKKEKPSKTFQTILPAKIFKFPKQNPKNLANK